MDNRTRFILSELQAAPAGMTAKELASATGIKATVLRDALGLLVADGTINAPRGVRQTYTVPSELQRDKAKARARLVELLRDAGLSPEDAVKMIAASAALHALLSSMRGVSRNAAELCNAIEAWHVTCDRVARANAAAEGNPATEVEAVAARAV